MSKTLRTVATIAGSVALIATGVGAVAGIPALAGVATAATLTAAVASTASQLTAPKPIARGSPAQVVIEVEPPRPYIVGQVMTGGTLRYDAAYGATLKRVPNPYRWQVRALSGVGPIQGILGEFFDFEPLGGFYTGFFATTQNLGDRPQATALVPPYGPAPGWTASSKLSGIAHVGLNLLFDRDGERFASGIPVYTALCQGEKSYDPRKDSTYPGGSGPCRLGDESTYVYSGGNPAIEAGMNAYGRFQDGKRIFGLGQSADAIDWTAIVDWANDCEANGWTANLILTEGGTGADLRQQRVRNLDDLCAAGGGRWFVSGGVMSFDWQRPRLSLATLTDEDILEAGGGTDAVPSVRDRMNGVRPQYISPDHNWQQITAEEIIGSTYRAEDGIPLTQVYPLNGVTNAVQAGQLASYAMADSRELGPIDLQVQAKWRFYRPGDAITIDSSLIAYQGQAVINQRSLNPETLAVGLVLKSETPSKHPFALGKVADPPPTPVLSQTPEERDLQAAAALRPREIDAAEGATRNTGAMNADGLNSIDASGALLTGQLPVAKAASGLINANVPLGANAAVNSDFTRGTFGWASSADAGFGVNAPGFFGQRNVAFGKWSTALTSGTPLYSLYPQALIFAQPNDAASRFAVPVRQGDRVVARALLAQWNSSPAQVWIFVYDEDGVVTESVAGVGSGMADGGQNGDPANFSESVAFKDITNPNSRWAIIAIRGVSNGTANAAIYTMEPFIAKVPAGQTTVPPYSPGRSDPNGDVTVEEVRTIIPQFPIIEIKQGEAGHTGNRVVLHTAKRGTTQMLGGTWSLPAQSLGAGTASIGASTGDVTLSGIVQSGSYTIRYTHTDSIATDLAVNVTYVPAPIGAPIGVSLSDISAISIVEGAAALANYSLQSSGAINITGKASGFWINPQTGMGDYEARATLRSGTIINGTFGTWLSLSSNQRWGSPRTTVGENVGEMLLEIRLASTGAVVASAIITIFAQRLS